MIKEISLKAYFVSMISSSTLWIRFLLESKEIWQMVKKSIFQVSWLLIAAILFAFLILLN